MLNRLNHRNNKRTHTIEENLRNISGCAKMRKSYEIRLKIGMVFVCSINITPPTIIPNTEYMFNISLVSIEIYRYFVAKGKSNFDSST